MNMEKNEFVYELWISMNENEKVWKRMNKYEI